MMSYKINMTIYWSEVLRKYGTVIGTVVMFIIFSLVVDNFFTIRNLFMLLRQMSMLTIIACGFTFVMAAGGFDMSIGNVTGLVSMIFTIVLVRTLNFWLSFLTALGVGLFVGLINALLVAYINLPDFIGTFAVGSIAYGIKMLLTKGNPIFITKSPEIFSFIGRGYIGAIPFPAIIMLAFLVITIFILHKTKLGRRIYAIGGNTVASVYAGINIKWYRMITFLVSGLSVSIAAVIMTSRLNSGQPLAGEDFLLDVIATAFLGTTMFGEGEANVAGSFVGAFMISMLNNALTMLNVPYYFQYITKGSVVIAAVMLAVIMGQKLRIQF